MGFPFLMPQIKKGDYYFGLFLKENKGIGCVLCKTDNKIELLFKEQFSYTDSWEHLTEDVDNLLSRLENKTKCHLEKTIFFFFSHFIDQKENAIKRPYSIKIKELTSALSLKAIGYIECHEAVSSHLSDKETFPLTTILIEIDQSNLGIFIYKSGHKKLHKIVSRTDSIIEDIISAFHSQQEDMLLPSRIVLYNSSNLAEESSKIISYRWSPDLFVQTPRVEVMNEEEVLHSLVTIFEAQICNSKTQQVNASQTKENNTIMGFVIGEDVMENGENEVIVPKSGKIPLLNLSFAKAKSSLQNIYKQGFEKSILFVTSLFNRSLFFPIIGIITLCLSFFCIEFFFHKAKLNLLIPTITFQKNITIDGNLNEQNNDKILISIATSSAKLSESTTVTGKRDIGEKAKGEIILYNFDDTEKTVALGTIIKIDSFTFQTTAESKVPKATLTSDASAKLPGKVKVSVISNSIGSESNLEKNKRFIVGDFSFSSLFAINETSFSGGTKNSIATVSKKDIDDLTQKLKINAIKTTSGIENGKKNTDSEILTSLTEVNLSNISSSKEVGEEGDTVTVSATAVTKMYYFSKEALRETLQFHLKDQITVGYRLDNSKIDYQIKKSSKKNNQFTFVILAKAKSIKNIDMKKISVLIRGKKKEQVSSLLKSEFDLSNSALEITPNIPLINTRLPLFEKNTLILSQDL